MLNRQQVWWRVARAPLVRLRDTQREGYTKMMSSKCEDYSSAGGGGVNSAGGGRPRTSATDRNSTMARERKRMRGRERDGERNSNKKEETDGFSESARAQREHMN
jgi:hypothetical protein